MVGRLVSPDYQFPFGALGLLRGPGLHSHALSGVTRRDQHLERLNGRLGRSRGTIPFRLASRCNSDFSVALGHKGADPREAIEHRGGVLCVGAWEACI